MLREREVHELLDMGSGVEAMAEAPAALARGRVFQPLGALLRPPDASVERGRLGARRPGAGRGGVARSAVFVDRRESTLEESGNHLLAAEEGAVGPDAIAAEVGEVLLGAHPGRQTDYGITLLMSLGIAVADLAAAGLVVRRARERSVGTEVAF